MEDTTAPPAKRSKLSSPSSSPAQLLDEIKEIVRTLQAYFSKCTSEDSEKLVKVRDNLQGVVGCLGIKPIDDMVLTILVSFFFRIYSTSFYAVF